MNLRVNYILEKSRVQGPGERFTIWVQGCSIHCLGCRNTDTWSFDQGNNVDVQILVKKIIESKSPGLTITGGEPLDQLEAILELTKGIFSFKDVFLCSGYEFQTIKKDDLKKEVLKFIDIICSGPFDQTKICQSQWKGSTNQEIICLTERGKSLINLPVFRREYRIDKKTGDLLVTGFS